MSYDDYTLEMADEQFAIEISKKECNCKEQYEKGVCFSCIHWNGDSGCCDK